jgi:stearoyl-CoA desaturase (delta-9 desaturase)
MTIIYGYFFYYFSAMIGHSIGYHRYFSHRSFTTNKYVEVLLLFFGLICGGRSPLMWCAVHRMHHSHSDTEKDPHSPIFVGAWRVLSSRFKVSFVPRKFLTDLIKNPRIMFFHKYGKWIHASYALAVLYFGINAFIVFVVFPFVLSWVSFGMLNYFAHKDGKPANIVWLNLFAPGEGWHMTHHKSPRSPKLHKFDPAGYFIEKFITRTKPSC